MSVSVSVIQFILYHIDLPGPESDSPRLTLSLSQMRHRSASDCLSRVSDCESLTLGSSVTVSQSVSWRERQSLRSQWLTEWVIHSPAPTQTDWEWEWETVRVTVTCVTDSERHWQSVSETRDLDTSCPESDVTVTLSVIEWLWVWVSHWWNEALNLNDSQSVNHSRHSTRSLTQSHCDTDCVSVCFDKLSNDDSN